MSSISLSRTHFDLNVIKDSFPVLFWDESVEESLIALRRLVKDSGIDGGGEEIVGGGDGVNVARQMQVKLVHRDNLVTYIKLSRTRSSFPINRVRKTRAIVLYLGISSARGTAFDTESRSLRRLPYAGEDGILEMRAQSLRQSNGRRRFALSQWRRSDPRHHHVFTIGSI